jgi:hypothetical protein
MYLIKKKYVKQGGIKETKCIPFLNIQCSRFEF